MGARERNTYRKMDAAEITAELFPEYKCFALLANLGANIVSRFSDVLSSLSSLVPALGALLHLHLWVVNQISARSC